MNRPLRYCAVCGRELPIGSRRHVKTVEDSQSRQRFGYSRKTGKWDVPLEPNYSLKTRMHYVLCEECCIKVERVIKYLSNEGGTSTHEGRDHQPGSAPGFVQEPR